MAATVNIAEARVALAERGPIGSKSGMMNRPPMQPRLHDPELDRLLVEAQKRFDAMTPEQKKEMRDAQRKSYVIGEFMMEHPQKSRAEAEEIYEKVVLGIGL